MLKSIVILIVLSLCIGTGAWLFFIWTVKRGDFDDIEGPKYRMLDDEEIPPVKNSSSQGENHEK
ncbi:MAG: cbb3-type cytochrome oxidase assembly protein CcoS [Deltaproteobacteria bacterium]|nr:cbb3-type cytochrome oxidase assembly protein CcoS [Deltaproteobacteria bacterium]